MVVAVILVAWLGAFGLDTWLRGDDTARNLTVMGVDVGGLNPDDLTRRLDDLAEEAAAAPIDLVTPAGTETSPAGENGLELNVDGTAEQVRTRVDDVPIPLRPVWWLRSLVASTSVTPVLDVDAEELAASPAGELAAANTVPAKEPGLVASGAAVSPTPGVDGTAITPEVLATQLVAAVSTNPVGPVRVAIEPAVVTPRFSIADAQRLADEANVALRDPVTLEIGPLRTEVDGLTLASWLTTAPSPEGLILAIDVDRASEGVMALAGDVGTPEVPVQFVVEDGKVTTSGGSPARRCCDPVSYQRIAQAMFTPERVALLELVDQPLERGPEWAASLGIVEPVGTFTTNFPAGQSRATNIIRIAEILRGSVIEPGATFSVNETTGPRGIAEGFVEGGIIVNGKVVNGVGGGISQFATTLFNAAFFAGLDIPDYMMHTLYISRYPYGREATLAWPTVDLKVTNNTPFGVLLWPTWTDDSITVTLYSTPWIVGEQTGQSTTPAGACTRVTTERTRTWLIDRTQQVDTFRALYQPEEGVLC